MQIQKYLSVSRRFVLEFLVFVVVVSLSSCAGNLNQGGWEGGTRLAGKVPVEPFKAPVAPWEFWGEDSVDESAPWAEAVRLEGHGELDQAYAEYLRVEEGLRNQTFDRSTFEALKSSASPSKRIPLEFTLRKLGLMLKIGKSHQALSEINDFSSSQSIPYSKLPAGMCLLAAHAYESLEDVDQSLAWFKLANLADRERGEVSFLSRRGMEVILSESSDDRFRQSYNKWMTDNIVGPVVRDENYRRQGGGIVAATRSNAQFFIASTYAAPADYYTDSLREGESVGEYGEEDLAELGDGGVFKIGVLLPLSGRFASHSQRVKQGIELAVQDFGGSNGSVQLLFSDTEGNEDKATAEYEYLTEQENVSVILGPLLYRTSQRVAELSQTNGTPVISFTKRQGIPGISDSMFRLGATSENQVSELVDYSIGVLGLKSFAALYPSHSMGAEYVEGFKKQVASRGGVVIAEGAYQEDDPESMVIAVENLSHNVPQAIFLPDSLGHGSVIPILEKIQKTDLADSIMLGTAQWDDPVAIKGFGGLLEGAVYVTPFFSFSSDSRVYRFVKNYKNKYRTEPELLSAQAYDAAGLVINNVARNRDLVRSRRGVRDALKNSGAYLGVTGSLEVAEAGEINRRMSVLQLKDGEVREVMNAGVLASFDTDDLQPTPSRGTSKVLRAPSPQKPLSELPPARR